MPVSTVEPKAKISEAEIKRRRDAVRYAISHNRLEGQFLDAEAAAVFEAYAQGEIDQPEIRQRLKALQRQP